MARATEEEVKAIISTTLTNDEVTPFLRAASTLIDSVLPSDHGYSAALCKEIETWLGAHFVAVRDPRAKSKSIGDYSISFEKAVTGEGLAATTYGQTAMALDIKGFLKEASKSGGRMEVFHLGTDRTEYPTDDD